MSRVDLRWGAWIARRIASGQNPARAVIGRSGPFARLGPARSFPRRPPSEDPSIDLNAAVEPIVGVAIVGLAVAVVVLLVLVVFLARQTGELRRRLDGLTRGSNGRSLDAVLDAHLDKVYAVAAELDDLSARSAVLEATGRRSIQRVGLVRFNPFEDTGGNQSFALALIDARGDGFVISSLHSRTGTRVYAKAVSDGRSDGALSDEEREALRTALAGPGATGVEAQRGRERIAGPV
jgi:Protein of unknown function (DUF4446)